MRAGFSFSHGLVPKQICDEGGSYGSWPQVVQGHGGSGYGGVSSSAPREKTRTGSGAKEELPLMLSTLEINHLIIVKLRS